MRRNRSNPTETLTETPETTSTPETKTRRNKEIDFTKRQEILLRFCSDSAWWLKWLVLVNSDSSQKKKQHKISSNDEGIADTGFIDASYKISREVKGEKEDDKNSIGSSLQLQHLVYGRSRAVSKWGRESEKEYMKLAEREKGVKCDNKG